MVSKNLGSIGIFRGSTCTYRSFKFIDPFTFTDIKMMVIAGFMQKYDVIAFRNALMTNDKVFVIIVEMN